MSCICIISVNMHISAIDSSSRVAVASVWPDLYHRHLHQHQYLHLHICISISICIYISASVSTSTYESMYRICICIYMHIRNWLSSSSRVAVGAHGLAFVTATKPAMWKMWSPPSQPQLHSKWKDLFWCFVSLLKGLSHLFANLVWHKSSLETSCTRRVAISCKHIPWGVHLPLLLCWWYFYFWVKTTSLLGL